MRQANRSVTLLSAAFIGGVVATCASAQPADERVVMLMRQDFSDCGNGDVRETDPSLQRGVALIVRGTDGITRVKVAMTVTPNKTYHFFLKCVRLLGDITTGEEGEGFGTFEFPTNSAGDVYAFDMYPEGAPAGDKFQSIQVRF
jgi:hypothetical protein